MRLSIWACREAFAWARTSFGFDPNKGSSELDPKTLKVTRSKAVGFADGLAVDEQRGAWIDVFGRASTTIDGGKTWIDTDRRSGPEFSGIREDDTGKLVLSNTAGNFELTPAGKLERAAPSATKPPPAPELEQVLAADPATSRAYAAEFVDNAIWTGALLPGGRVIVGRDQGLRMLATATLLPIGDSNLLDVEDRFAHCQPAQLERGDLLLACTNEHGAAVMSLTSTLATPTLEATFPEKANFVVGPKGRFGIGSRCGRWPPARLDFGASLTPSTPQYDYGKIQRQKHRLKRLCPTTLPRWDEARFCVRIAAGHWLERSLSGDDASKFYRWVPGDDGAVTALVLADPEEGSPAKGDPGKDDVLRAPRGGKAGEPPKKNAHEKPAPAAKKNARSDGVRVIHLDPRDPALEGGAFPALLAPSEVAPFRSIEPDFWEDDDGSIRGWVQLGNREDKSDSIPALATGPAGRMLRVATQRGGRMAGVRIGADASSPFFRFPKERRKSLSEAISPLRTRTRTTATLSSRASTEASRGARSKVLQRRVRSSPLRMSRRRSDARRSAAFGEAISRATAGEARLPDPQSQS